jgi:predicted esterase
MIDRILRVRKKPLGCILCLPGREDTGRNLAEIYKGAELRQTMIVGMTPKYEWYPAPNGPNDQTEAIAGLSGAVEMVEKVLTKIRKGFGVKKEQVVLVGFSAGAVVALETFARSKYPFAAVVCHSGAILDHENFPHCKFTTVPVFATHCQDDTVFSCKERFWPMCDTLEHCGYNLIPMEHRKGNHSIFKQDIIQIASGKHLPSEESLARRLGYPEDWRHSQEDLIPQWEEFPCPPMP